MDNDGRKFNHTTISYLEQLNFRLSYFQNNRRGDYSGEYCNSNFVQHTFGLALVASSVGTFVSYSWILDTCGEGLEYSPGIYE